MKILSISAAHPLDEAGSAFVAALSAAIIAAQLRDGSRASPGALEAHLDEPGSVIFEGRLSQDEFVDFAHARYGRFAALCHGMLFVLTVTFVAIVCTCTLPAPWPALATVTAILISLRCLWYWRERYDREYRRELETFVHTTEVVGHHGLSWRNIRGDGMAPWSRVRHVHLLACGIEYEGVYQTILSLPNRVLTPEVEDRLADLHRTYGVKTVGRRTGALGADNTKR